jgi:hypothetical protein
VIRPLARVAPVRSARARRVPRAARAAAAHGLARLRAVPRPLAALLAVAAIQVTAWAALTPPFQGPDESGHFAYAQYLAETGKAPEKEGGNGKINSTEHVQAMEWANLHSLIGILTARPAWSDADEKRWERVEAGLPGEASADGQGPNAVAGNPPLYYAFEAIPYHFAPGGSLFARFFAMRLTSALFYLAAVGLVWLIAAELFRPLWARTLATSVAALHPKLASLGSSINPDVLLLAIWTAFLYVGVRTIRHGPTRGRLVAAGALAAASVLTHGRGLAIVAPLIALLAIGWLRHRPPRRTALIQAGLGLGLVLVGLAILVLFKSVSDSGPAYGGEISTFGARPFSVREFLSYLWQFYLPKLDLMQPMIGPDGYGYREVYIEGFYGHFASLEVTYPRGVVDLLAVATVVGLFALYTAAVVRWRAVRRAWDVVAFLLIAALSMILLVHLTSYKNLLSDPSDPLFAGRYLLPLVSIFAVGVTAGVVALPRRLAPVAAGLLVATGVALVLSGLGMTLVRFYA